MTHLVNLDDLIRLIEERGLYCDTDADKQATIEEIKKLPHFEIRGASDIRFVSDRV